MSPHSCLPCRPFPVLFRRAVTGLLVVLAGVHVLGSCTGSGGGGVGGGDGTDSDDRGLYGGDGSEDPGDFGTTGPGDDDPPGFADYALQFGMNSSFLNWTGREIVFADAMMRGMEFGIVRNGQLSFDEVPLIPLGEDPALPGEGWPDFAQLEAGESAGSRLLNVMEGTTPDGTVSPYVLTWEGTGACSLRGPGAIGEQNRTANRVEVFVDPTAAEGNAQLAMFIDESSVLDPVRGVHVWYPDMEDDKQLFWPSYLEKVEAMNHGNGPWMWRATEWTRVNMYGRGEGNLLFSFDLAGMIRPSSPSQGTRRGVCPEFIVAFCNATRTQLHFQVPHRTDDMSLEDYVTFLTETFTRVRDGSPAVEGINGDQPFRGLDPSLTVTVELANEIWNPGFAVHGWMNREALRKGISFEQQVASQLEIVFGVADQVFAGVHAPRLRKFIGAFTPNPSYVAGILAALPAGNSFEVDALGPAAYFGPSRQTIDEWLEGADSSSCPNCPTVEEVIAVSRARIVELRPLLAAHRALADGWTNPDGSHPALEIYEAGQSLVAGYQPWAEAAAAAQVHPLMYDAYALDLVPVLLEAGVDVVNWYSFMTDQDAIGGNGLGPFGIWNDMHQTITLPVPDVYVDEGVPKAAAVYRGPPLKDDE